MNDLDNRVWGPALWMILHSSAERIGTKSIKRLPHEEVRIWANLLSLLRQTLPCPVCKHHYSVYFQSHPLPSFTRESMRVWIAQLHHEVNQRLQKPIAEGEWPLERIEAVYSEPFHFSKHYSLIRQQMMRAFQGGWIHRDDINRVHRAFDEIKRFYDFF